MDSRFVADSVGTPRRARVWLNLIGVVPAVLALTAAAQAPEAKTATTPLSQPAVELISAEDFGALPFMGDPKLSPSGQRVAARAYVDGAQRLIVLSLSGDRSQSTSIPIPDQRDLRWFRWAGENKLLLSIGMTDKFSNEELYVTRLMMVELATSTAHFIGKRYQGLEGDDVLYVEPEGRSLLLSISETVFDSPSVWDVDLSTLKMKKIVKAQPHVWEWYADWTGVVRAGVGVLGKRWWLLYRKDADAQFEKVFRRKTDEDDDGNVEGFIFADSGDRGYVVANKPTGRFALYHYDFKTDTLGEPIFEHPSVDIDYVSRTDEGGIEAVYYTDDRSRVEWFDPAMKQVQTQIDQALPDRINRVVSSSRERDRMIVWTASGSDPGHLYIYLADAGMMKLLAKPFEKITGKPLAPVESVSYKARDGLEIPAYLTIPRARELKALPLVVMPHGGPFARDRWQYDVWAQFLANRGYLVLQPNFRGSTGYGKSFVEKGLGQYGRGMQDDIDDGVRWLIAEGKADPKRVCIMGASFGGYAALWGAARNPDLYRCAISYAGVTDVAAQLRHDRKSFGAARYFKDWRESVQGDKDFDLKTVSPLYAVDRISIPVLIAHGTRDERVLPRQSKKMHEALTRVNKPHEFVMYEGEGHGFEDPKNLTDFLVRVEAFLKTHNPADTLVAGNDGAPR